jgi:hypothetical protein
MALAGWELLQLQQEPLPVTLLQEVEVVNMVVLLAAQSFK